MSLLKELEGFKQIVCSYCDKCLPEVIIALLTASPNLKLERFMGTMGSCKCGSTSLFGKGFVTRVIL